MKPETIITEEELQKMLDNSLNYRDKAIFSTLYDSGCRLGELLSIRIRDVLFDDNGGKLIVNGKTGVRSVRVVGDSVVYLRSWLEVHPDHNYLDAPVFCRIERPPYRVLEPTDIYTIFRMVMKRAGITRRIYPHLFRHTRATILSSKDIGSSPMESQMGWVHGSSMMQTYVHLSAREQDEAVLKAYGIVRNVEKKEEQKPRTCPKCGELNVSNASR